MLFRSIDLERRRNDETALPGFLGKLAVAAVAVLGQVLAVVELGHPVDADTLDRHDSKNVSNRGKNKLKPSDRKSTRLNSSHFVI